LVQIWGEYRRWQPQTEYRRDRNSIGWSGWGINRRSIDWLGIQMTNAKAFFARVTCLLLIVGLTGCGSTSESVIDPITGMDSSFCSVLKSNMEKADTSLWTLGQPTSVAELNESFFEAGNSAATISIVSEQPAKSWLDAVAVNAGDIVRYFSGDGSGGSEELMEIASRWKASFLELEKYCE